MNTLTELGVVGSYIWGTLPGSHGLEFLCETDEDREFVREVLREMGLLEDDRSPDLITTPQGKAKQ